MIFSVFNIALKSICLELHTILQKAQFFNKPDFSDVVFRIFISLILLIKNDTVVKSIFIASLVLHALWALSSFILLIGNQKRITSTLWCWVLTTSLVIVTEVSFTIYFLSKAFSSITIEELKTKQVIDFPIFLGYATLAVLFDKEIIIIAILIALTVYVSQRAREISEEKSRRATTVLANSQTIIPTTSQRVEYPEPPYTKYSAQSFPIPHIGLTNPNQRFNYAPSQYMPNRVVSQEYMPNRGPYQEYCHRNEGFMPVQTYGDRLPEPEIDYDIDRNAGPYYRGIKRY